MKKMMAAWIRLIMKEAHDVLDEGMKKGVHSAKNTEQH